MAKKPAPPPPAVELNRGASRFPMHRLGSHVTRDQEVVRLVFTAPYPGQIVPAHEHAPPAGLSEAELAEHENALWEKLAAVAEPLVSQLLALRR
jgi:hypothetical protein